MAYRFRREFFGGALGLVVLMAAIGWCIYSSYQIKLHDQWDKRADVVIGRFNRSLSDAQLELGVLGESLATRLSSGNDTLAALKDDPLVKRLHVSEVILHPISGPSRVLFQTQKPFSTTRWRATIYDFMRTNSPQSALEITEYGPRVLDIEPVKVGDELCGIEVAIDLESFLKDFARREGVELAFLVPAESKDVNAETMLKVGAHTDYKILASSTDNTHTVLSGLPFDHYLGRSARGIAYGSSSAFALLTVDDVEYRSVDAPTVGARSSLVIWSDYSEVVAQQAIEMRHAMWLTLSLVFLASSLIALFVSRYRRLMHGQLHSAKEELRATNASLQGEVIARQRIEERLRGIADEMYVGRQNDMKLMALLAHQLKLSASSIVGFAEILTGEMMEKSSKKNDKESLQALQQVGERLFLIGENIDLWSRRDALLTAAHIHPQPMTMILDQAVAVLRPMAERKALTIKTDIEENLIVSADTLFLEIMVKNLLSNAIKFSPHGAEIKLAARKNAVGGVEMSVTDHGQGISRSIMEKLFEPDSNKLNRGTDGEEGLGLGLLIIKWVCKTLGAQLKVLSDEGQGCRVSIAFPAISNADARTRRELRL